MQQMYIFCPLTRSFDVDESRPLIIPHEHIQPIEIHILEYRHNIKYNHKFYNLIQNTSHEYSDNNEELNIIRALELLWSLLQTKNVIRMLVKLLASSDTIRTNFPNGFFDDHFIDHLFKNEQNPNKIYENYFLELFKFYLKIEVNK